MALQFYQWIRNLNNWTKEQAHEMVRQKYASFIFPSCSNVNDGIIMVDKMHNLLNQTDFNDFINNLQNYGNAHSFDVVTGLSKITTYEQLKKDNYMHMAFFSLPHLWILLKDDKEFTKVLEQQKMKSNSSLDEAKHL